MPKCELDAIDRRIVTELQSNARLSNIELADRVGLSPSPCLRRVRRLEQDGYIDGYRASLRLGPHRSRLLGLSRRQDQRPRQRSGARIREDCGGHA